MTDAVLAVDIGGTKIAVALVHEGAIGRIVTASTPGAEGPEAVFGTVARLAAQLTDDLRHTNVVAVGVASKGVVDVTTGRVLCSTRAIVDWSGTDVAAGTGMALRSMLGATPPVHVLNDVDAFALGELSRGAARGIADALVVAVGTGVGAALILDGRVRRGRTGAAGELGHVPVVGAGHLTCSCGWPGHLEAIGCGAGLLAHYHWLGGDPGVATGRDVSTRAGLDEPLAVRAVGDSAAALGRGIAAAVAVIDPDGVVVCGGGTDTDPIWWESLERHLRAELIDVQRSVPLLRGRLGAGAPLHGAAIWAMQQAGAAI